VLIGAGKGMWVDKACQLLEQEKYIVGTEDNRFKVGAMPLGRQFARC
jgi:hypothetical protein